MHLNVKSGNEKYTQYIFSSQTWVKPPNVNFLYFTLVGAGGAGGSTTASVTNAGGGAGGGSGSISTLLIPSHYLPDLLYFYIGAGGPSVGQSGFYSYISLTPTYDASSCLLYATGGGAGGNGDAGGSATAAGGTSTAATISQCYLASYGIYKFIKGSDGGSGGNGLGGAGASLSANNSPANASRIVTGGAGGAGRSSGPSGSITSPGGTIQSFTGATIPGGIANTSTNAVSGFFSTKPLFSLGGAGAASNSGGGGRLNGGDGGPGCGGGGGGPRGSAASIGGKGGDGFCIILGW